MKKYLPLSLLLISFLLCWSQKDITWQTGLGNHKVFIENRSQFNGKDLLSGSEILFAADDPVNAIYFTKSGLTYKLTEVIRKKEDEQEPKPENYAEKELKEHKVEVRSDVVHMEWINCNTNVQVEGEELATGYENFRTSGKSIDHADCYKKIVYKNLYPGIDVEYIFHEKDGVEYSFILHPGADISLVKMKYSGTAKVSIDNNGHVHISTKFGDIIDHAPSSGYLNENKATIPTRFIKNGKNISFELGSYDKAKTLVLDPWTATPAMPNSNRVFHIDSDTSGNAYIFGGDTYELLEKYNSAGVWQWTFNTNWDSSNYWLGTLKVDPAGNSYITVGPGQNGGNTTISKISTTGSQVWTNTGSTTDEYWGITFNCDFTKLLVGGTRIHFSGITPNGNGVAFNLNPATGAQISNVIVGKSIPGFIFNDINEIRSICSSPNGNYYFLTLDTVGCLNPNLGIAYETLSTYRYAYGSPSFAFSPTGQHTIAASLNALYTTDGANVSKRDINTGAIVNTVTLPGGSYTTPVIGAGTAPDNGGIAIDTLGNVYVGSQSKVVKFDANLNVLSSATTPSAVYAVAIGKNGDVFACGKGYAVALAMSAAPTLRPICITQLNASLAQTNPLCAGSCTGSATANTVNGTGPYLYSWSNGATTQTISNLCAATYTVTVTDQANNSSATVSTVISQPAAVSAAATPTAATCGNANGSVTASINSGTGPFTYAWSNGASGQTISNVAAGSYTVTATNTNGCTATASATVASGGSITLSHTATATTCGNNNGQASVTVTAGSGPYTYLWSNGNTTSAISSLTAGNYTVTVSGGGCSATSSASVAASTALTLSAPVIGTASCGQANGSASISVASGAGPYTYAWNNGSTTAGITNVAPASYMVTVTGAGSCTATASAIVDSSAGIILSAFGGRAGCTSSGTASVTVTSGTGPFTYLWSNGETTADINSLSAGNYSVTVTGNTSCTATATVTVISTGSGVNLTTASAPAGCSTNTGTASVTTTSGTAPFTYAWSNGATTDSISSVAGGSYTVTVTSHDGCTATANIAVSTSGALVITTASTGSTCGGSSGSASVTPVGTGPFTYNWSNGGTTDSISNVASGTYTVTVQGTGSCSATANATVSSSGGTVNLQADQNTICQGDTAQICAPAGFHAYLWNNGQTSQCINATATGNYYVTVSDNGACTATSNHVAITVNVPATVTITVHGDTLKATGALSYQWYLGNNVISGATSSTYVFTQDGTYSVKGTDGNGCVSKSNSQTVKTVGIDAVAAIGNIKIYPNPLSNGSWHVEVGDEWIGSNCEVVDAAGRVIYNTQLKNNQSLIELNVAQGIYLMRIHSGQNNYTVKLIKL